MSKISYLHKVAILLFCLSFFWITNAFAVSGFEIEIPVISSPQLKINNVSFNAEWLINQDIELKAKIGSANLLDANISLNEITLVCIKGMFDGEIFECREGKLKVAKSPFGKQDISIFLRYNYKTTDFDLRIKEISLFGGSQKLNVKGEAGHWNAEIMGSADVLSIKPLFKQYISALELQTLEGKLKFYAKSAGYRNTRFWIDADLSLNNASIEDKFGSGVYQTNMSAELDIHSANGSFQYELISKIDSGFFYYTNNISENEQDFYSFELNQPVNVDFGGSYNLGNNRVDIDSFFITQKDILNLDASIQLDIASEQKLKKLSLNLNNINLKQFLKQVDYPEIPFVDKNKLSLAGGITGAFILNEPLTNNVEVEAKVEFAEIEYGYDEKSIGISGVNGVVNWSSKNQSLPSTLSWAGGNFQLIPFDKSILNFTLGSNFLKFDKFSLPVLGGKINVDSASVQDLSANLGDMKYKFGVEVEKIDITKLTQALSWPQMEGVINAEFPQVTFAGNLIELGGSAKLNLFKGGMIVENLKIEDPIGVIPRMNGDITINDLDLEELSSTFKFGRITGKLSGYAHDIELEQWFPVSMDMSLYTSDNDDTKRRISQKAVDFISDIGGVGGSLSRTYLSIFEEFSYNKIGINLKLEDGVCNITGIEPKGDGYYIVKGSFIPRIDIVGYESKVSWIDLIDKIKGAIESGAPVTN